MYKKRLLDKTQLKVNKSYEGETIEQKINRIVNNKEPIKDGAPLIYSERKDGVQPQYDIRTDRFEIAIEAMDKVSGAYTAQRDHRMGERAKANMEKEQAQENKIKEQIQKGIDDHIKSQKPPESGAQSTQATDK